HGAWLPWLKQNADVLGFDDERKAQRLMNAASKYDVDDVFDESKAREISRELWGNKIPRGSGGSGRTQWYTPEEPIGLVRMVLGGTIDLDPASHPVAQQTVRASRYFTETEDGLSRPWDGTVYLNPPYSKGVIGQFIDKLITEYNAGRVSSAILLT